MPPRDTPGQRVLERRLETLADDYRERDDIWGRDFGDVTPLKGVIHGGGSHTLEVGVTVTRLEEAS